MDLELVRDAVGAVQDPELHRGLGDLGMVRGVEADGESSVRVLIALTIPGCPLQDQLTKDVSDAARGVDGVDQVKVEFTSMNDAERSTVVQTVRGEGAIREVTIGKPGSKTRVIGIASGKGGVGKSTVTVNLGVALARQGKTVGLIDADVWGFSIPKMLGIDRQPVVLDEVILPPEAFGVSVMSMDYFVGDDQPVIWRGPMLHKAIEQFLVDVLWDEPDFLLIDMPPGTGDVAISLSQFLPRAETDRGHDAAADRRTGRSASGVDGREGQPAGPRCCREHVMVCRGRRHPVSDLRGGGWRHRRGEAWCRATRPDPARLLAARGRR